MNNNLGFAHRFEPGSNAEAPPLLLLHGTGGDEQDLLPLGRRISPESALLSPRGKVLENGMPRFFRRLSEGIFDQEDLALRTKELAEFIHAAAIAYGFDEKRLIALGFSNGANIAASLLFRFPQTLAGAILIRPMVPFLPNELPDLRSKPVLLLSGRRDPIVPLDQPEGLASLLREAGADAVLRWQDSGHALTHGDVLAATDWLSRKVSHVSAQSA